MKNKALIISGGGAKGAFGCGLSKALREKKDYSLYVGTSTGSLQIPLIALNRFDKLEKAYLSVTQKDIFNFNPFNKNGSINIFKFIYRLILNKDSLGETKNLKKRIETFFGEADYENILKQNKEIVATTVSMTTKKTEFKSIKNNNYRDMIDWIWASANTTIFASFLEKNGEKWTDGGIKEHIPIQYAIDNGCDEIDVIVHRPINYKEEKLWCGRGIIKNLFRMIQILYENVSEDDIAISKLEANDKDIVLNIFYTPYNLTDNSMLFDKKEMEKWWDLGYEIGKMESCKKVIIGKKNLIYTI